MSRLKERFLSKIDVEPQNVFSLDGTISQDAVKDYCRLYEQRIQTFGGLDLALFGIGRSGNIAVNEPGSSLASNTHIILVDSLSREEMTNSFANGEQVPPCCLTMGMGTILKAKRVFVVAWGEEKASIVKEAIEGKVSDTIPASFLQTHSDAEMVIDLGAASDLTRIKHPWLVTTCQWDDKARALGIGMALRCHPKANSQGSPTRTTTTTD